MSGRCFVDTNILIYAHDVSLDPKHHRARELIEQLWATGNGVLSTQVLQEFAYIIRRKPKQPLSIDDTLRVVRDYLHWHVVINTPSSVVDAMGLELRYRLSFWDALILSAAQFANAEILYTEDLSHGQRYGSVHAVNPFA
jgi:predicted nucleic acid-binding protein